MRSPILAAVLVCACHAQPGSSSGEPATCTQVADHVLALMPPAADPDHAKKLRDVLERRCHDDHWADDVTSCMIGEGDLHAGHHCQDKLTAEQRTAFTREIADIDMVPPEARHATVGGFPAECEEYGQMIATLQSCMAIPQQARDALRQSFDQQVQSWMQIPVDQRAALTNACKTSADAVRQVLSMCNQQPSP